MYNRPFTLVTYAGIFLLAVACSGDSPAGPGAPGQVNPNAPVSNAIKSDIATSAGNAIASNLEDLVANQVAAIGSFAVSAPSFSDGTPAPAPEPEHHDSTPASEPQHTDSNPPATQPEPEHHDSATSGSTPAPAPAPAATESCGFDAATLFYSCVRVGDNKKVVKSYQFLDGAGKPMEKFVHGVTDAIHFLLQSDGAESGDNFSGVSHSKRDVVESGFLGPNRVYNGFGVSADTNSHKQDLVTRKYSGVAVDTLQAVTFVDQRNEHPYPLSGVAIRVVDYTVVSSGTQLETTTLHKRLVVTFNGTADVPLSLGDYSCVLHLDTHKVDSCK
ncbi:MAG TPA: hypothetical protein VFP26_02820 [Gemmatimonadaceae bacterium]|nr:hypothetical protein [Gemmatimonadaceae bacterium]